MKLPLSSKWRLVLQSNHDDIIASDLQQQFYDYLFTEIIHSLVRSKGGVKSKSKLKKKNNRLHKAAVLISSNIPVPGSSSKSQAAYNCWLIAVCEYSLNSAGSQEGTSTKSGDRGEKKKNGFVQSSTNENEKVVQQQFVFSFDRPTEKSFTRCNGETKLTVSQNQLSFTKRSSKTRFSPCNFWLQNAVLLVVSIIGSFSVSKK